MSSAVSEPTSIFALLMLGDEPLAELTEERRKDTSERFAFCRRLGREFQTTREQKQMTLDEVAFATATSPRYLRCVEEGILDASWISDETIEAVAEILGLDSDNLYED